jgi:Transposase
MRVVGWDWASTSHDVTVLDEQGRVVERWALPHTEHALAEALTRLARHGQPAELPVIIERSAGLVVDRLLAAGHPVVPVHPTAFHAARPRWGAAGAKSDPGDSYKLADYLRTDGHRLRRLQPLDPGLRELQALVRLREDHVRARTAASNQLGALLDANWPGPKAMFCKLASDIALAFLTDYPTPRPPPGSAKPAWPRSAAATPTAAASHQPNSWPDCGQHRSHPAGWRLPCSPS